MPMYTDSEGNEVEIPFTPEEAEAKLKEAEEAKAKAAELEEKIESMADLEKRYEEASKRLNDLEKKDFDFSSFRKKTQKEKDELLGTFSKEKKEWVEVADSSKSEIEELRTVLQEEYKEQALNNLAGNDEELRAQLIEATKQFVGEPKTRKEVLDRYHNAYVMVKGVKPTVNPMNSVSLGGDRTTPSSSPKKFTDTEKGKASFDAFFPDLKDKRK